MQHWVDGQRFLLTPEQGLVLTLSLIGACIGIECFALIFALCKDRSAARKKLDNEVQDVVNVKSNQIFSHADLPASEKITSRKTRPTKFQEIPSEDSVASSINLGISKSSVVNKEEMTLQEFKKALMKQAKMTLEEFYRSIDKTYSMSVTVR